MHEMNSKQLPRQNFYAFPVLLKPNSSKSSHLSSKPSQSLYPNPHAPKYWNPCPIFFLFCIYACGSKLCFTGNSSSARPVKLCYIPERVLGLWCTDLSILAHGLMYTTNERTGGQEEAKLAVEWVLLLAVESHAISALSFLVLLSSSLCPPVSSKCSSWFVGYLALGESLLNMS